MPEVRVDGGGASGRARAAGERRAAVAELRARRAADERFSVLREGSLHAALKALYAGTEGTPEATLDGFVVDVARGDEVVEIQTASLASIRRKLERLVETHRVVLVHPVALERRLVRVDANGEILARRRSPKHGLPLDAFEELLSVRSLFGRPNFRLEIVFIREDEVRGPALEGVRHRYPRTWRRLDRRLVEVVEIRRIDRPADLVGLLPAGLPQPFTSADLTAATGRSKRLAMRTAYCLEQTGVTRRVGRRGRLVMFELTCVQEP